MAKKKKQLLKGKINAKVILGAFALLVVAVPLTMGLLSQQTNVEQHASGASIPGQAITNLNSSTGIVSTLNTDGTMGPKTAYGNWSNSLPPSLKGQLNFSVTDPVQGGKPSDPGQGNQSTTGSNEPKHALPTKAQGQGNSNQVTPEDQGQAKSNTNGPQTVTALNLTISKVEVHLAYQGEPGDNVHADKPTVTPETKGKAVDKWETLVLTPPFTVDLVQLAKNKTLQSLGLTELAAGRYTEIRLYVQSANAQFGSETTVPLQILGKDNIVRVVRPFTISAGKTTTITMDFDAQHSVVKAGGVYLLKPVVARLLNDQQSQ